jgi:hypothetical protein
MRVMIAVTRQKVGDGRHAGSTPHSALKQEGTNGDRRAAAHKRPQSEPTQPSEAQPKKQAPGDAACDDRQRHCHETEA